MSKTVWPKLYKVDNIGNMRVWWIEATQKLSGAIYTQYHGIHGGKIQETSTLITNGKNSGKSNETTYWEQCKLEAESLWKKQKDRKGYSETPPNDKPFGPMLAKEYTKDGKHIKFPCAVQPKLDGCVSGDTLIKVRNGYKTIKYLVENKIFCDVATFNTLSNKIEYKQISHHFLNKEENENIEWYEIELETGEILKLTNNHPVYLPDLNCWRRVDELKGNENLMVI